MAGHNNEFIIKLTGHYEWHIINEVDNTSNQLPISRQFDVVRELYLTYAGLVRAVMSSAEEEGFKSGPGILDLISFQVEGELDEWVKAKYKNLVATQIATFEVRLRTTTFVVEPNSSFRMTRVCFYGPGVTYMTDLVNTDGQPAHQTEVSILIRARLLPVLKDIEVVYTRDARDCPVDIIKEARGGSADIRKGFGGMYVWLRATWTQNMAEGATGMEVIVSPDGNLGYLRLNMEERDGPFRYLRMLRDPQSTRRITDIALWREGDAEAAPPMDEQFESATGNLNRGRGGDSLYLRWNGKEPQ